eukprot:9477013-Pyramimonas_sp.AAC.1
MRCAGRVRSLEVERRSWWGKGFGGFMANFRNPSISIEVCADPGRGIPGPHYDRGYETRVTRPGSHKK